MAAAPYLGELAAHGIGSWFTPVGLIENLTEFATVSLDGSWLAGIVAVTLGARMHALTAVTMTGFRVLLLPVVFSGMRNNYTIANLRPQVVEIQDRARELDQAGDEKAAHAERAKVRRRTVSIDSAMDAAVPICSMID